MKWDNFLAGVGLTAGLMLLGFVLFRVLVLGAWDPDFGSLP